MNNENKQFQIMTCRAQTAVINKTGSEDPIPASQFTMKEWSSVENCGSKTVHDIRLWLWANNCDFKRE